MKISLKFFALATVVLLAACASTPKNPFVGAWSITVDTPIGSLPGTLNLAADGTGSMAIEAPGAESQPPTAFENVTFTDNKAAFSTTVNAQGQQLTFSFNGTVEGDDLTGAFDTDFGQFAVSGTRK